MSCKFAIERGGHIECIAPRNLQVKPKETRIPGLFATAVGLFRTKKTYCDYPTQDFPSPNDQNCPIVELIDDWEDYIKRSNGQPTIQSAQSPVEAKKQLKDDPPKLRRSVRKR